MVAVAPEDLGAPVRHGAARASTDGNVDDQIELAVERATPSIDVVRSGRAERRREDAASAAGLATLLAIACFVLLLNNGDVSSLPGYSPGTTSAWTRDEGWTVTYANGTVSKQEGDGWTVTTGGSKSEEDEDD